MKFLKHDQDYEVLSAAWGRYRGYMDSMRGQIPKSAYEFAMADWHYNPKDHRALHDSWLDKLAVTEKPAGRLPGSRVIAISLELLGPYHDGKTILSYQGVQTYSVDFLSFEGGNSRLGGHGDWLIDEIILGEFPGTFLHEIQFSSGVRWRITCESLDHWTDIPAILEP